MVHDPNTPPPKPNSRRRFLKQSLFGSLILGSTRAFGFASSGSAQATRIPDGLKFFSPPEFQIMKAVAERLIGIDDRSAMTAHDAVLRADEYLSVADPGIQEEFHQLLTVFNAPFFTFLFDWRFSSFLGMTPEDQDTYLEDWMTSTFAFRRTGFQALKRVALSMYYTDSRTWGEIGYDGMFLPWERT